MKKNTRSPAVKAGWRQLIPTLKPKLDDTRQGAEQREEVKNPPQKHDHTKILSEISLAIASNLDLDRTLDILLAKIGLLSPYSAASVRLLNRETGELEPNSCWTLNGKAWKTQRPEVGQKLTKLVLETKAPLTIDNVQTDPSAQDREFSRSHGLISYLGLPLIANRELLGVLSLYTKEDHRFVHEEVEFLTTLAAHAATAIYNCQLFEKTRRQAVQNALLAERVRQRATQLEDAHQRLSALHAITTAVNQGESAATVLRNAVHGILKVLSLDAGLIYVFDESKNELRLLTHEGFSAGNLPGESYKPGEGLIGHVFETGKPRFFKDLENDPRFRAQFHIPITVRNKCIGIMSLASKNPRDFSTNELNLISSIADHLGMAVDHATLLLEIREKTIEVKKSTKVTDEFLRLISHELRTPLTAVLGYAEMLRDRMFGEVSSEQHRALEKVVRNTYELLATIMSIMEASRIESGEAKVEDHKVSLSGLLSSLTLSYPTSTLDEQVALIWDFPSELPTIRTDGEKLKLILQNLIDNAIKFTERGSVTVSARCFPKDNSLQFKVADTGIGIPKQARHTIFEMFRKADSPETRPLGGVGLGLYIVKRCTELLGGKVEVKSEPDKGSTFTITLPYEEVKP